MTTRVRDTCLVLDLDDTLYKEREYQTSGLRYVEKQIFNLYGVPLAGQLVDLRDQGVADVFAEATKILGVPTSVKQSFVMMYRYHSPDIGLTQDTSSFLQAAKCDFGALVVLTDGRSATQRMKLRSLGLADVPAYISEEWESEKPDQKRFKAIMAEFKHCSHFYYVADNPAKDFIAPNALGWTSICLKGDQRNVYSQSTDQLSDECLPSFYIRSLREVYKC